MGGLEGRVAVVSGGASGIGAATVRRLASEGMRVIVADISADGAALAQEVGGTFERMDVSDPVAWDRLMGNAQHALGGVDLAFLNAGFTLGAVRIEDCPIAEYRRAMGVMVDGVWLGVRAVVPSMKARGGGTIVVTSSLAGLVPSPGDPVYNMAKHAVVGLARGYAQQLAEVGITINAVCPGMTETPLIDGLRDELVGFPTMQPEAIADVVVACAQAESTGQAIVCQAGTPPYAHPFKGVPGARHAGGSAAHHVPRGLSGEDPPS
jgi:NAD(P)-dependent dehydrogenase (short-subunit alcohol dehydrogenase family)